MGIRNLAYCLMEHRSDKTWTILAWDNVDLLSGGQSAQTARRCCACSGPAAWSGISGELWCKGCATGVRRKKSSTRIPTHPALPCGLGAKELRDLAVEKGLADKKAKKDELLKVVSANYLMPWKAPKAVQPSLFTLRQQMSAWLTSQLNIFQKATLIRLENQPVMKGPTMKSVQIMLFTLLGHRLETEYGWNGRIEFVHAGVKTKEAEGQVDIVSDEEEKETDEGKAYRARKKTAEQETLRILQEANQTDWISFFTSRSKKNDLADAFLMAHRMDLRGVTH